MNKKYKFFIFIFAAAALACGAFFAFAEFSGEKSIILGNIEPTPSPTPKLPEKLLNPPKTIKAVYATVWTASTPNRLARLIDIIKKTEINAIVIDIKDYSGKIAFSSDNPVLKEMGTMSNQISNLSEIIQTLHENNIYAIARIAVFQDPALAEKRPDLAIKSLSTGKIWRDRLKLAWLDPSGKDVWNYIVEVARETDRFGFDEINFDYVRFPSDGKMNDLAFPFYDSKISKQKALAEFFSFISSNLRPKIKISADLFGLVCVNKDDLGIGQVLEEAAPYFDWIYPMVYPSHYAVGFNGYKNPAAYPYEVIKYSLVSAKKRLDAMRIPTGNASSTISSPLPEIKIAGLRPWLQDFDLGADYNAEMVRLEKKATIDSGFNEGWLLWDPANNYTVGALDAE